MLERKKLKLNFIWSDPDLDNSTRIHNPENNSIFYKYLFILCFADTSLNSIFLTGDIYKQKIFIA